MTSVTGTSLLSHQGPGPQALLSQTGVLQGLLSHRQAMALPWAGGRWTLLAIETQASSQAGMMVSVISSLGNVLGQPQL